MDIKRTGWAAALFSHCNCTAWSEKLTLYALIGMSITTWIRSPKARLAMRTFGPLLIHLFTYIIFSRAEFPTMPTTKTTRETAVLTNLKASLIPADSTHIGGCGVLGPASRGGWIELLGFCFSSIKRPGEAVSESSITASGCECWSLASPLMRIFPKQRASKATVHIVDDFRLFF